MTLEELKQIPLRYTFGYSADTHAVRQYENTKHGIAKQVITPRSKKTGKWGTGKATYMLLATKEEFTTIDGLLAAINTQEKNT
ncbi:hypothetical protein UFOVP393_70 [uncultured Caudovirales phage]|uniref:Uncharacterized protein n=1 Tax=uncultured Caudovirales phage TaxID=2100421 RepID=A0A6J7X2L7_9CAUD|nr:hypothetical protein UFOVP393_70 [uncultured Caudovirales phage]